MLKNIIPAIPIEILAHVHMMLFLKSAFGGCPEKIEPMYAI